MHLALQMIIKNEAFKHFEGDRRARILAMFEVATRKRILSAKKGTPDTAVPDVYNLNLIGINRGLTSFTGHEYKLPGKFGLVVKANLPLR